MTPPRARFPRRHRLKRQRLLRPLFDSGRADVESVRAGALVVRYRLAPATEVGDATPVQVAFATGRRLGDKPARNRVKRAMREAFRLHQHRLVACFSERSETLTLVILYRGRAEKATAGVRRNLPVLLERVADRFTVKPPDA